MTASFNDNSSTISEYHSLGYSTIPDECVLCTNSGRLKDNDASFALSNSCIITS